MKKIYNKGLVVLAYLLIIIKSQFNQQLQQKNIYQDVADYHEKG